MFILLSFYNAQIQQSGSTLFDTMANQEEEVTLYFNMNAFLLQQLAELRSKAVAALSRINSNSREVEEAAERIVKFESELAKVSHGGV